MNKNECDYMHGFVADRFAIEAHLIQWSVITKFRQWRFYPESGTTQKAISESSYDRYEKLLLETDDIDTLSSELYVHIIGSLLRKSDNKLLDRFTVIISELDQKIKAVALLKAYNFLAVARRIEHSTSAYWQSMEYGDFYDHHFVMLYTYHYLIHAEENDQMKACGSNYIKFFTEPLIGETKKKLEEANNMLENLMNLEYVHSEILCFYKSYAKNSGMSLEKLQFWLRNAIGDSYNFTE